MKKLAILLGFLALTSQTPFCPYQLVPTDLLSSLEYGRNWTSILLQAYGLKDADPAAETKQATDNSGVVLVASAHSETVPEAESEECPLAAEFSRVKMDGPLPVEVESVSVNFITPENIQIDAKVHADFQKQMQKQAEELRKTLNAQQLTILSQIKELRQKDAEHRAKIRVITRVRAV